MYNRYLVERQFPSGDYWEVSGELHHTLRDATLEAQRDSFISLTPNKYRVLELKVEVAETHPYQTEGF